MNAVILSRFGGVRVFGLGRNGQTASFQFLVSSFKWRNWYSSPAGHATAASWNVHSPPPGATLVALTKTEEQMAEPTYEELKARLAELESSKEAKRSGALSFKVSDKGGASVYGLGRFPVTLYYEQWQRLLGAADELRTFLEESKPRLKL